METAVRSRMRAARIYDPEISKVFGLPKFSVHVDVFKQFFEVEVGFWRWVDMPVEGVPGMRRSLAITWHRDTLGTHGNNPGFILQIIGKRTDEFIDTYLGENEQICEMSM